MNQPSIWSKAGSPPRSRHIWVWCKRLLPSMVGRPCCGMLRSSQHWRVWRTLMVRRTLMIKINLAHSPLLWTLSRLFSWVQDTGIPSLRNIPDKIFQNNMFHCVTLQRKGPYLHILTVGATSLAHVTFGLPRIAVKSENFCDH